MSFQTDDQTLKDLNLLGKFRSDSIFNLFNHLNTRNGEKLLEHWFNEPMSDPSLINKRAAQFQFFHRHPLTFPWKEEQIEIVENYLSAERQPNLPAACFFTLSKKVESLFISSQRYDLLLDGMASVLALLSSLQGFITLIKETGVDDMPVSAEVERMEKILNDDRILRLLKTKTRSVFQTAVHDYWIKNTLLNKIREVLDFVYQVDVMISISNVARDRNFGYAIAHPAPENVFKISGFYHPAIERAVGNSISFNIKSNVMFLTGANMAGKSTFMKAFGIALYLAHMGFPVPASHMEFSVKSGLYTSINLSDNLQKGLSHFYAEVLRVKEVAQEVVDTKNIVVIFDELFKGTNVKDAFDATLEVTKAFATHQDCFFLLSTHIIEVGEQLQDQKRIQFVYLPTYIENHIPRYTYQLQSGISKDRQGMDIVNKEGILQLLNSIKQAT